MARAMLIETGLILHSQVVEPFKRYQVARDIRRFPSDTTVAIPCDPDAFARSCGTDCRDDEECPLSLGCRNVLPMVFPSV